MTDDSKKKPIRILSKADHLQSKSSRGGVGWRPTNLVCDEPDPTDELSRLTGEDLDRELRRQILYTIPWLLELLFILGLAVFALAMRFPQERTLYIRTPGCSCSPASGGVFDGCTGALLTAGFIPCR